MRELWRSNPDLAQWAQGIEQNTLLLLQMRAKGPVRPQPDFRTLICFRSAHFMRVFYRGKIDRAPSMYEAHRRFRKARRATQIKGRPKAALVLNSSASDWAHESHASRPPRMTAIRCTSLGLVPRTSGESRLRQCHQRR